MDEEQNQNTIQADEKKGKCRHRNDADERRAGRNYKWGEKFKELWYDYIQKYTCDLISEQLMIEFQKIYYNDQ